MIKSERIVINILNRNKEGTTITELTAMSHLSRSTVRVALAKLEGGEKVLVRNIGMAKVYSLKN